jgi:uncharacterized integral membrane protein (TIGR00698 family)
LLAVICGKLQASYLGAIWIDDLIFAILFGTIIHSVLGLPTKLRAGVKFASKTILEVAIVLLGASISFQTVAQAGLGLFLTVALIVPASLLLSYGIARALGLSDRLAVLVACGNSICGNSAIVAAAPIIDARPDDVAASISFTAALGILVVLVLPLVSRLFGLGEWQYGFVAGMTVYAVPQVLAATVPVGPLSTHVGTIVKLTRVLMLGPVILLLGLRQSRGIAKARLNPAQLVPWFIIGFIVMMAVRSHGAIPEAALKPIQSTSSMLTTIAMAALGLSVDLRSVAAAGGRVLAAGALSILALAILSALALLWVQVPTFIPLL